jgi:hypothetical protein
MKYFEVKEYINERGEKIVEAVNWHEYDHESDVDPSQSPKFKYLVVTSSPLGEEMMIPIPNAESVEDAFKNIQTTMEKFISKLKNNKSLAVPKQKDSKDLIIP